MTKADRLDQLILQLRLTTLMRSGDASNTVWALFHHDGQFFIRTTDKKGSPLTFNVSGVTPESVKRYLHDHVEYPAPHLFRYLQQPQMCLGADRLAKQLLDLITKARIDTTIFKSHSLRGATATHLLLKGVPQQWVQQRGQWASSTTLDQYYNRLHQHRQWGADGGSTAQPAACLRGPLGPHWPYTPSKTHAHCVE